MRSRAGPTCLAYFWKCRQVGSVAPNRQSLNTLARASPSKCRRVSQRAGNTSVGQIPFGIRTRVRVRAQCFLNYRTESVFGVTWNPLGLTDFAEEDLSAIGPAE